MAAGLTIDADKVDALAEWLDERLARNVAEASADRMLAIDALISPRGLNPLFVDAMEADIANIPRAATLPFPVPPGAPR